LLNPEEVQADIILLVDGLGQIHFKGLMLHTGFEQVFNIMRTNPIYLCRILVSSSKATEPLKSDMRKLVFLCLKESCRGSLEE
jgi:hypothetical protein